MRTFYFIGISRKDGLAHFYRGPRLDVYRYDRENLMLAITNRKRARLNVSEYERALEALDKSPEVV